MKIIEKISPLLTICLLCLLAPAEQGCSPQSKLPNFFKYDLSMASMYKDMGVSSRSQYNYIYNYPVHLLESVRVNQISTLLSVSSIEWSYNARGIDFSFHEIPSETALLISMESGEMDWKNFRISILINDWATRDDLYFGEVSFQPSSLNKVTQTTAIPNWTKSTKLISFIIGVKAKLKSENNLSYEISVTEESSMPNQIQFTVSIGVNTFLQQLSISFIAYQPSQAHSVTSGVFTLYGVSQGATYRSFGKTVPTTDYFIFGIQAIQVKTAYKPFGISFELASQYILKTRLQQFVDKLQISYFGIGPSFKTVCSNCPQEKYIYSNNLTTTCLPKCSAQTYIYDYQGGFSCIECPTELNMTLSLQKSCVCGLGFIEQDGRCILFQEKFLFQATSSLKSSDCTENNTVPAPNGSCICTSGYQRNDQQQCVKKCVFGYWDGFQCVNCSAGTYPWYEIKQCRICVTNCFKCSAEYVCQTCKEGFQLLPSKGQCQQICGDEKKFTLECDDGNKVSNDGCSQFCKVEPGFECNGGSASSADTCTSVEYRLQKIYNQIVAGSLVIDYRITPPLSRFFGSNQLSNMISFNIPKQYAPWQIYINQDSVDLGIIRIVFFYGNLAPYKNFPIEVSISLPGGHKLKDSISALFLPNLSTLFSQRSQSILT